MFVVLELGAGTFQVSVVVEQFQPPQKLLRTAGKQSEDVVGTEKTMPVDEPDDLVVTIRQLQRRNCWNTIETGKAGFHRAILNDAK